MDVIRLNKSTFLPDKLVENYDSMIWTERYSTNGDFELKSKNVEYIFSLLPQYSLISLRTSLEVMIVETHLIEEIEDENGFLIPVVTVTGRSLETFLQERFYEAAYSDSKWPMQKTYRHHEAAAVMVWNSVVNPSGHDVTWGKSWWYRPEYAILPNTCVSVTTTSAPNLRRWWLEGSPNHYDQLMNILTIGRLGIRCIRPKTSNATIVTVQSNGTITKTPTAVINKLRFDIYEGKNRTQEQNVNTRLVFHYQADPIEDQKHLFTMVDWKTHCYVMIDDDPAVNFNNVGVYGDGGDADSSGWNYRPMTIDGGKRPEGMNEDDFFELLAQKGEKALKEHNRKKLYECSISPETSYIYGKDYGLGDLVTVAARYGIDSRMLVTEYTLTEDTQGERGYPTLVYYP